MRRRRHTGHSLHNIEHGSLNLQQTQFFSIHLKRDIAGLHMVAIVQELLKTTFGVKIIDDLLGHFYACQHSGILDNELLTTHLHRRNTTERGMVTIAYIFLKPNSNKLTKFFFFHNFNDLRCKISKKFAHVQKKV